MSPPWGHLISDVVLRRSWLVARFPSSGESTLSITSVVSVCRTHPYVKCSLARQEDSTPFARSSRSRIFITIVNVVRVC